MPDPHEGKEALAEREAAERPPFLDKEIPYDAKLPWRSNARKLLEEALHRKYHEKLNTVLQDVDEAKLNAVLEQVKTVELKDAVLIFKDSDKKTLYSIDIRNGLTEARHEIYRHDCALCQRRSRRLRIYEFRHTSYSDMLMRLMASRGLPEGRRVRPSVPTLQEDPRQAEANRRLRELFEGKKASREDILRSAQAADDEEYDILANVSTTIQNNNREEFERNWRYMDFSHEIDELCTHDANPDEGYKVNPLKNLWGKNYREGIRELIQESRDDRLYFKEVAEKIYNERYKKFKNELADAGVPDAVLDLLDRKLSKLEIMFSTDTNRSRSDNLQKTFKRLKKIAEELAAIKDPKKVPEKYKEIWPHREKLDIVIHILGDYIAYATQLINLVQKLRYNKEKPTQDRERLMFEPERGPGTGRSNRVKEALHELFMYDVDSPVEYAWYRPRAWSRKITFSDLNGDTLTAEGEWFTQYQSPETAYKLAFEEAEEQTQDEKTGKWRREVNPERARDHINQLLELGIAAYGALPGDRSLKDIIDDLHEAGAEVEPGNKIRFSGSLHADIRNLYHALSIKELGDLKKKGSERQRVIAAERLRFVRIGSVIWQKNQAKLRERAHETREKQKQQTALVKLQPSQADEIVEQLKQTGKFGEAKLAEIRRTLIGGVGAVLSKDGLQGAGGFLRCEIGNGFSLNFSAAGFKGGAHVGVGVGKKFEVREDIDVSIVAGPGYAFGERSGWTIGAGGGITKKFSRVDIALQTGAGVLFAPGGPGLGVSVGVGFNWTKPSERYEREFTKREAAAKIDELDKTGDPYNAVKENPEKYPQFASLLYNIESISSLDAASQRAMFESAYEMFKEKLRSEAIDETTLPPFTPTGIGIGVAMLGPLPVPYAYMEFELWSRKLVYRIGSDAEQIQRITEARAIEAILVSYGREATVVKRTLRASGELLWDPESRKLLLKSVGGAGVNFRDIYDKFPEFRDELSRNAKIFAEQTDIGGRNYGLLRLKPQEAHGVTQVYVDPKLAEDVIVVTRGSRLYISVKKDREIFIRREDVTYPFKERGAVETSAIIITDNPHMPTDVIKGNSTFFMEQLPGEEWVRRPRTIGQTLDERAAKKQENLKTWKEYMKWWGAGRADRLEFLNLQGYHESYDKLIAAVTIRNEQLEHAEIRPAVKEKIEALTKDAAFIKQFRDLTTQGFNLIREGKPPIISDGSPNMPELIVKLKQKLGEDVSALELNAAFNALFIASFQDLWKSGDKEKAKQKYFECLENFHKPLLKSIFTEWYKGKGASGPEKKAEEAAQWIFDQYKDCEIILKDAEPVKAGIMFATLVGMPGSQGKLTGVRSLVNFFETSPVWGVAGKRTLNPKSKGVEGDVARFWLEMLSPFSQGISKRELPSAENAKEFNEYQDEVYEALHSPLVLKLVPLIGVMLMPTEMNKLTQIYEGDRSVSRPLITKNNSAVRKFLGWCERAREAELAGKKELALEGTPFKLALNIKEWMGIYKECGNVSGLLQENFALVHEGEKKIYFAGMGEGVIDVKTGYTRVDYAVPIGAAIPLPQKRAAAAAPPSEKPPPKQPPPEQPPPEQPPPEQPPPGKPPTAVESRPEPGAAPGVEQAGGSTTGRTTTETGVEEGGAGI